MPNVKDKWFRIISVVLPFLLVCYTNGLLPNITMSKLISVLVSLCSIIIVCESTRYLVYNSHRWFGIRSRFFLLYLIGILWTAFILGVSAVIKTSIIRGHWDISVVMDTRIVINEKNLVVGVVGYSLLNSIVNFSFMMLAYEFLYRQWLLRTTQEEKDKLEKEKLKAELLQLKGIVNPHFLFNNLNSLSSLISESPEKAQEFLDELTKVFRYLLRNNQTELTTLSEELKFIQTYYQLLRTRYGRAINMVQEVDKSYEDLLIPPLTLQLLVENAVKHNKLQKDNPLQIELISAGDHKLVVRNNVFRKEGGVESTGIGLQTINARYGMLNRSGVVIEKTTDSFSVIIPLIKNGEQGFSL